MYFDKIAVTSAYSDTTSGRTKNVPHAVLGCVPLSSLTVYVQVFQSVQIVSVRVSMSINVYVFSVRVYTF